MVRKRLLYLVWAVVLLGALPSLAWAGEGLGAGREALAAGDNDLAIEVLTRLIDSKELTGKDLGEAHHLRGQAYENKGYLVDAEMDYKRALSKDRRNELYRNSVRNIRWRLRPDP